MQPIVSAVPVDAYAAPRVNASYKRANGEAPLSRRRHAAAAATADLPASVCPQLQCLGEDDLKGIERRMYADAQAAARQQRIDERVRRVAAAAHAEADVRSDRLRQRAARHAWAAGEVRVRQIQEEYRTTGLCAGRGPRMGQ